MEVSSNIPCPVCTLYLLPGITLETHLLSHPKQKVIEALCKVVQPVGSESNSNNNQKLLETENPTSSSMTIYPSAVNTPSSKMFFDMNLLCYQRQGKFRLIWLAATHGLTSLKKQDVDSVNIENICNEILRYVLSPSTSPEGRLPLYVSGKLLYGAVTIYRQQVDHFGQTVPTFFCSTKRPSDTIDCDDNGPTKKRKTTRPKTLIEIEDVAATAAQAEQIRSYVQEYERDLPNVTANVIDSLLDGDFGRIDPEAPNFLGGGSWPNIPDAPIPECYS